MEESINELHGTIERINPNSYVLGLYTGQICRETLRQNFGILLLNNFVLLGPIGTIVAIFLADYVDTGKFGRKCRSDQTLNSTVGLCLVILQASLVNYAQFTILENATDQD